jgi:hypothetical protein
MDDVVSGLYFIQQMQIDQRLEKSARILWPVDGQFDIVCIHTSKVAVRSVGRDPKDECDEGQRPLRAEPAVQFLDFGVLQDAGIQACVVGHDRSAFSAE